MANPTVYLNGKKVGSWRYGYNSFWIDATDAAQYGGSNALVVHADTREHGSRWYPGAGIYRKVGMRLVDPVHIPVWGVFVTTPEVTDIQATIHTSIEIVNSSDSDQTTAVGITLLNPAGKEVEHVDLAVVVKAGESHTELIEVIIDHPAMWDVEHPDLYTCITQLKRDRKMVQKTSTTFGIRTFQWTANDGFHLNGRRVQLKGVNLHHDHGPLGAAFFPRAMERQLEIMKEMGVNAIRTSHNACAPEVLDLCDRMGIIVFNELFDKYGTTAGVQCTTGEYVDSYAEAEVANFVRRDRNHPSVFVWSIGNEIPDLLLDSDGRASEHVAHMVSYFKKHDTTRPTTMGNHIPSASEEGKHILDALETSGWNYGRRYVTTRQAYPDMPLIYSESASAFGTRGAYKLPLPKQKTDWTDEAELFLNGESLERRQKIDPDLAQISQSMAGDFEYTVKPVDTENPYFEVVDAYRLRWMEVPYTAGELKAIAYKGGELIGEAIVKTAGKPHQLRLTPDRTKLNAGGMDLCYMTIEMIDEEGNVCPLAMDMLEFRVVGAARLMGVANGNQMGHDVFTDTTHPLFYGKAVAVLRSIPGQSGTATLEVRSVSGKKVATTVDFF